MKKGNQWHFGMKRPIGVDSRSKLLHSVAAISFNVHDSRMLPYLLHGNEAKVRDACAYTGQTEVIRRFAPHAQDFTNNKGHRHQPLSAAERGKNRTKPKILANGEHPLLVLKHIFGLPNVRYRGLTNNANPLVFACALVNSYMNHRPLLQLT